MLGLIHQDKEPRESGNSPGRGRIERGFDMRDRSTLLLTSPYRDGALSVPVNDGLVSRRDVERAYRKLTPANEPVRMRLADGSRAVLSYVDAATYAVEVA